MLSKHFDKRCGCKHGVANKLEKMCGLQKEINAATQLVTDRAAAEPAPIVKPSSPLAGGPLAATPKA